MIQITRNVAREVRAVFKRLLCGHRRTINPTVQFNAGPDGLFIRSWTHQGAVQFHVGGEFPATSFAVPLSALEACEGKSNSSVTFDVNSSDSVSLSWEEGRIPRQQSVSQAKSIDVSFPETPQAFAANPPELLTALKYASQNAADDNTRYVLDHLQLDGPLGQIVGTDGKHLLVQTGFQFPWQEAVLIPASSVFASPEFPRQEPVGVAHSERWFSLSVGPWLMHLPINQNGRFPKIDGIIPRPERIVSRLQIADADAQFLLDAIPRLPGDEVLNHPVTIDLNGEVIVRATASDQPKPTELVLTNSRLIGEPVKINVNREYLARAIKLGFRELGLINPDSILTCNDDWRKYLVMPLEADRSHKSVTDAVRIESGTASPAANAQRLRVSPSTTNNEITMPKSKNHQESPPEAEQASKAIAQAEPTESTTPGPIGAAIELRESLRTTLADLNTLIASLRRQKRQQKLMTATLASLKQLQKVAG